ncbi:hypothetical protein BDZ45DRAFT_741664 [Acephala macrosclerotiorum]|nr:hypothetical protein BDZ45DRAFT_741664 [Acephala macrosclerotiorum]
MPPKSKFSMDTCFNLVTPGKDFKSYKTSSDPSASPATSFGSSSSSPSGNASALLPPRAAAVPAAPGPLPAQAPGLASQQPPAELRPADPMDTTTDYDSFGTLGSPQAAWVYQMIIYPALCRQYGGVDPSVVPAWAHHPAPFIAPAAFLQHQQQQHQQAQQQQQAAAVAFAANFFAAARAAANN